MFKPNRLFLASTAVVVGIFAVLSIVSLPSLPDLNIDEVGNCVVSQYFLNHGRIIYSLANEVVHPYFSPLMGLDALGLRAPYYFMFGWYQKLFGFNYLAARGLSLFVWFLVGGLLFLKLRAELGTRTAGLGVMIFATSFDGILASHLIRGDIFLSLLLILVVMCVTGSWGQTVSRSWFWAGFLGSLAFFGVHPNGLLILIGTIFMFAWKFKSLPEKKQKGVYLLIGLFLGWLLSITFMDLDTFLMAKNSIVQSFYGLRIDSWKERIWPWNFISDVPLFFLRTQTFYLSHQLNQSVLWSTSAVAVFFSVLCSLIWTFIKRPQNQFVNDMWGLSLLILVGLGFGAAREERIYQTLLTLSISPVLAWLLFELGKDLKEGSAVDGWVGAGMIGLFWAFRSNILFQLGVMILSFILLNMSDRKVMGIAALSLVSLFLARLRGQAYFNMMDALNISQLTHPLTWIVIMVSILIIGWAWMKTGRMAIKPPYSRRISAVVQFTFLVTSLAISRFISLHHISSLTHPTENLNATFHQAEKLVGPHPGRILGPEFLWLWKQHEFFDVGGIIMDKYYSSQSRPRECIARVRPDILIIDDNFKRRYLIQKSAQDDRWKTLPLESILPVSSSYVGSIPTTWHHSRLDFYRLNWPKKKNESAI